MADSAIPLLFNPVAGRGSAARRIADVVENFASADISVEAISSRSAGDIEAKAQRLSTSGESRILVAGGDGSVHEAVNGLLASESPASFGLVPLGTGNDFAKANGIPLRAEQAVFDLAARLQQHSSLRKIDVGLCNARHFANGVGIGFDAKISRIAESYRLPMGTLVYPVAVVRGLIEGVVTPQMSLDVDGRKLDMQLTLASFNIGQWVGGLFPIAPTAVNDDGKLDLVYVDALTRWQIIRLLPKLLRGTHLAEPRVHHQLITNCHVRAAADIPAHLDGENQPLQRDFAISIKPGALQLL